MSKFSWIFTVLFCIFSEYECLNPRIEGNANIQFETPLHTHVFKESNIYLSTRSDIKKQNQAWHDHIHEVVFVIRQRNMDELTSILHDISDPYSPNYGQHWSREEVVDFTSNPDGRDAVVSYLHSNGASSVTETLAGEYITAQAPIKVWEKILNTKFFSFLLTHHDKSMEIVIRAEEYWIPKDLDIHVASVLNTIEILNQISKSPSKVPLTSKIDIKLSSAGLGYMTPTTLREYYNMSRAMGSINSTQAVFASIGQYYSPKNLATFQQEQGSFVMPVVREYGNHANDTVCMISDQCAEANLDVQYIMTMSPKSPTTFWYTDSWFTTWLVEVSNSVDLPKVLSFSYITREIDLVASQHDTFDVLAIKLGTMGVTIVVASGDYGSGYGECGYKPGFPAASPYVLTVGGTIVSRTFAFICIYSTIDLFNLEI